MHKTLTLLEVEAVRASIHVICSLCINDKMPYRAAKVHTKLYNTTIWANISHVMPYSDYDQFYFYSNAI